MIVSRAKIVKLARRAKALVPQRTKPGFGRIIKFAKQFPTQRVSSWKLARKIATTGLSKSSNEIRQLYDLLDAIRPIGFIEKLEMNKALRLAASTPRISFRKKTIPSSLDFINTCKKLKGQGKELEKLTLLVLLASGRRTVDITRLDSARVCSKGQYKYQFVLSRDKKNRRKVVAKIDFSAIPEKWRPDDLGKIDRAFNRALKLDNRPFSKMTSKNFNRLVVNFRTHSIRSLLALHLTRNGLSDDTIKSIIGWRDERSLKLYRVLTREEAINCPSLDHAVSRANFIREN